MSSGADVQFQTLVHHGSHIVSLLCHRREALQHVESAQCGRIGLERLHVAGHLAHEFREEARFQFQNAVLRAEDLVLQFLQFLRDVAFRLCQRLLPYPLLRHAVLVGIPHLDVVAEHIVEADAEARYARLFRLALLDVEQEILARGREPAQFVEFRVESVRNHAPLVHQQGRVRP